MGSPTNAIIGLFMLWWGWLAFNAGSTFGVTGNKWRLSAKVKYEELILSSLILTGHSIYQACVTTLLASFSGGLVGLVYSAVTNQVMLCCITATHIYYSASQGKQDVLTLVNGILGGLVGVTASCAVVNVFEAQIFNRQLLYHSIYP